MRPKPPECLLHVPLVIVPPSGTAIRGSTGIDHLVNTVDIFPTLLHLANLNVPHYAQGHDLLEWVKNGANRPLRDAVFAQVGDYHGFLGATYPCGMPASGRHPSLLQSVRNTDFSYIHDPDYGDEAYNLTSDPHELCNLLNPDSVPPSKEIEKLKHRIFSFEEECINLRERLSVIPGDRGFVKGWE